MTPTKTPVTILTGFLGAGKTTLLNHILTGQHGRRIAVIENEYGEIGIDHELVIDADEEIFEMSNGCICCTVRGDLIRILGNLMKRKDKFDYVLVETTGLADPGPVAQTFFMDDEIREAFSLDGIVTLVDARHIDLQLGRNAECEQQIAFADVVLLNKIDLVDARAVDAVEARVRAMNRAARVLRCTHGEVPVDAVLGLGAFDLEQVLTRRPTFLEPEYPFEWTGVFELDAGAYELALDDGPDPTMSALLDTHIGGGDDLTAAAERAVRAWAAPPKEVQPGGVLPFDTHARLRLEVAGEKRFSLHLAAPGRVALFAQHLAEEFDLRLAHADGIDLSTAVATSPWPLQPPAGVASPDPLRGAAIAPVRERVWVAQHEHGDEVGSVAIDVLGDVDAGRLDAWIGRLLRESGQDIFRMKGFIAIDGDPRRFVFQGVHMLFDGTPERPWGDSPRRNQLVFIGRNLDARAIRAGFDACLA